MVNPVQQHPAEASGTAGAQHEAATSVSTAVPPQQPVLVAGA
jgi:hypothetical protein